METLMTTETEHSGNMADCPPSRAQGHPPSCAIPGDPRKREGGP